MTKKDKVEILKCREKKKEAYNLSLLSYLWHYNGYFAFTRDNRTHEQ